MKLCLITHYMVFIFKYSNVTKDVIQFNIIIIKLVYCIEHI